MNILITSAGQRVSLVKAFKQELSKVYPGSKVLTTDMSPEMSAACNVSDGYIRVRRVTDPGYIDELLSICQQHQVKMVVPTIDTELMVLAQHRDQFTAEGIHLIISSPDFIDQCRDKRKINTFFEAREIRVPAAIDKYQPSFPLFIKPYNGSLSADTYVVHSQADLREEFLTNERLLFMEYLSKQDHDEYTVDMYYDKAGDVKCIVPRKRILVRAGEINKGITSKNGILKYLRHKLAHIDGAVGCLTAQFFLNKQTEEITAIEINARFGGGYPLSYHAGANYPLWLIEEYFQNRQIEYTEDWEDQLLMLRYDDEVLVHANRN
ncbi:ATP-grasp domain-containing protein [Paraflavitalea sp. CAU 1676]|uniref:ATP-grasp domain-containing protein n=1 Tax=Paraflavitalea sp. CAU 1676 TaxID=3032598 RepID=UPI0023D9F4BC|nr:ATP-grasp domain-containing protein [Paraflavitalea sp. CAU 1676]MDF2189671.1 ATP-grasp domain-containing protein [Paraflavitalea sp. CAU 1676]